LEDHWQNEQENGYLNKEYNTYWFAGELKMKKWKYWPLCDCPNCGSSTELLTDCEIECETVDCDLLRCSDPECPRHTEDLGHTIVYAVDDVGDSFEGWPIGDDGKPYRPVDLNLANKDKNENNKKV
jgi:hypothetical protein